MSKLPTLYKQSTTGKISEWDIVCFDAKPHPYYEITFGYENGAKQTQRTEFKEGKNKGRKNETTSFEQCEAEAMSKWTKQRDRKGYSTTGFISSVGRTIRPMLAKSYTDEKAKLKFPCFAQPKLDGIRCLASKNGHNITLMSRQGKRFVSLKHIENQLNDFFNTNPNVILDGELYVHGESFQQIVSAIKRDKPSPVSHLIEYHVYDIVDDKSDYIARNYFIETKVRAIGGCIKIVPTWTILSEDKIEDVWRKATEEDYEGIMLRNKLGFYKIDGRSSDLLKCKKFMDAEFEIVDAYENTGTQVGQCTLVCKTKDGTTFGVKPEGSKGERCEIWEDFKKGRLTGSMLTVRFFEWTTSTNPVPRFPIGISIRDYE